MSIFDALPKPSERVEAMLRRDLSLRVSRDLEAGRWNGYHYKGGADLVLRHGQFWSGRDTPDAYMHLRGEMSACFDNSLAAAEADASLTYVEGYAHAGHSTPCLHAWCVAPDGGVVELTLPSAPGREGYIAAGTMMPYLPPDRWGYFGVRFTTALARAHEDSVMLPIMEYGKPELAERARAGYDLDPGHDNPLLKVPYDPDRKVYP